MHKYLMSMLTNSYKNKKKWQKNCNTYNPKLNIIFYFEKNLMKSRKIKDDYENTLCIERILELIDRSEQIDMNLNN